MRTSPPYGLFILTKCLLGTVSHVDVFSVFGSNVTVEQDSESSDRNHPGEFCSGRLNNLHHQVNHPLAVFMKCCVCPAMSPHYLNIKVEAHSSYPRLTVVLLLAGSAGKNPTPFVEKPVPQGQPHLISAGGVGGNSHVMHAKTRGPSRKGETCFQFWCGFSNPPGARFRENGGHWDRVLPSTSVHSNLCLKVVHLCLYAERHPKRPLKEPRLLC